MLRCELRRVFSLGFRFIRVTFSLIELPIGMLMILSVDGVELGIFIPKCGQKNKIKFGGQQYYSYFIAQWFNHYRCFCLFVFKSNIVSKLKYQEVPVWRQVPLGVFFLFINFFFRLGQANVYLQLYVYRYISFSFYQIGFFIFTRLLFLR